MPVGIVKPFHLTLNRAKVEAIFNFVIDLIHKRGCGELLRKILVCSFKKNFIRSV